MIQAVIATKYLMIILFQDAIYLHLLLLECTDFLFLLLNDGRCAWPSAWVSMIACCSCIPLIIRVPRQDSTPSMIRCLIIIFNGSDNRWEDLRELLSDKAGAHLDKALLILIGL